MSKIIVREYDNSKTGISSSNNFTVALAGYAVPEKVTEYPDIWDENKCAEFTSQADFVKYVGTVAPTEPAASAGSESALIERASEKTGIAKYYTTLLDLGVIQVVSGSADPTLYTLSEDVILRQDSTNSIWYILNNGIQAKQYLFKVTSTTETAGFGVISVSENDNTLYYKLTPVYNLSGVLTVENDSVKPVQYSDKGEDIVLVSDLTKIGSWGTNFKHQGNQIAYELLGLGFPIIYKRIDSDISAQDFGESTFWECFRDKSLYNFRYIMTGHALQEGIDQAAANQLVRVCEFNNSITLEDSETLLDKTNGRGDCVALCDFEESGINTSNLTSLVETTGAAINALHASKFSAIFGPCVIYGGMSDSEVSAFGGGDTARTFPASFHYLACAANSLQNYNEWYAVAGATRGIAARTVTATTIKYGDIANNTLSPRVRNQYAEKAANLVVYDRGTYILKGNRTAQSLNKSGLTYSHYLNIRQLCTTIKKRLYSICSQLAFDPNSDLLWQNFLGAIKPALEAMKADQGIDGYKITKVNTTTKGVLKAIIRIVPVEAVEDFDISLSLEDSLDGIAISADEQE